MTADDDAGDHDHELDAMMSSMRGVWREMRDEEPPARGLDALLAAARTKAVEMAPEPEREPWWRRVMAMLVRPPVLAAATVVVLVGTTALLSRRDALDTATPARRASESAPARERPGLLDKEARKPEAAVSAGKGELEGKLQGTGDNGPAAGGKPAIVRRPTVVRPPPPTEPDRQPARPDEVEDKPVDAVQQGLAGDVPSTIEVKPPADPAPGNELHELRRPKVPETVRTAPTTSATPIDQLVKQAETAAGRKDCAAVRGTAERIRKLDATAYKTRVVTQPAIKRCL